MNTIEQQIAAVLPDVFVDTTSFRPADPVGVTIAQGKRNDTLTQMAGWMRRKGFEPKEISAALHPFNQRCCGPTPLPDSEVEQIAASIGRYPAHANHPPAPLVGLTLDQLTTHVFPERKPLLVRGDTPVFREGHLGQLYSERGTGKTWFVKTLALVAASGGEALGFRAPAPCRVLDVDGEMASGEIQERYAALSERLGLPTSNNLTVVAADWQEQFLPRLDTPEGQAALEPFIEQADFIILDNRSCLFDPEGEKDAGAWQPAQDWLLSLRRRGKGVLLAHHSNRQGGARGHSKPEDPMNLLMKLTRPEDYTQDQGARFLCTFDKARGAYGAAVAPFMARLTPAGWELERHTQDSSADKLRAYLRLAGAAKERPKSATKAIQGAHIQKADGLRVWADLLKRGEITKLPDGFALRGDHEE